MVELTTTDIAKAACKLDGYNPDELVVVDDREQPIPRYEMYYPDAQWFIALAQELGLEVTSND